MKHFQKYEGKRANACNLLNYERAQVRQTGLFHPTYQCSDYRCYGVNAPVAPACPRTRAAVSARAFRCEKTFFLDLRRQNVNWEYVLP
mmetsp:Transcript_6841/g.25195  ORF Transcript_6841/g.25195 Transcript_6841/m.25195 type:complete len:88 (+) Transcript_6841:182-445(+)